MDFDLGFDEPKEDLMLLDIKYHRGQRETSWSDQLQIVYKVLSTGEKKVKNIDNPTMDVYFAKEGFENTYYKEFMPLEALDKRRFPYKDLEKAICDVAGGRWVNYFHECIQEGKRRAIKEVHKYPNVYGSDYDIIEWYKIMWLLNYNNDTPKPVTRGFFDIEVNIVNLKGFPKNGERAINLITIIDADERISHTMVLREHDNMKNIEAFEAGLEGFEGMLHEMFDETYGHFDYRFYMYDEETQLIKDFFLLLKTLNKDFYMVWNMDFDIPYILDRVQELGMNIYELIHDKDFDRIKSYYKKTKFYDIVSRDSNWDVSMKSVFLDQMVVYAAMRKGQGTLRSNKLNAIGQAELGDEKLDYGEATNLGELQMIDFFRYVAYNIKDVLMQFGIDEKTRDIESLYHRSLTNCVSYTKAFKQTKFLENRAYFEYYNQGLIIGNNVNLDYTTPFGMDKKKKKKGEDEEESFAGGLVADPKKNGYNGITIHGSRSKYVYKNVVDFDFSSMYPNEIATLNISRTSMVGKLLINSGIDDIYRVFQNVDGEDGDELLELVSNIKDKGHAFMEEYLTQHFITLGKRWFNLPGTEELIRQAISELDWDMGQVEERIGNLNSSVLEYKFKLVS